ncbi:hypothetical protein ACLKA7_007519 [Drosophila subpalustris]
MKLAQIRSTKRIETNRSRARIVGRSHGQSGGTVSRMPELAKTQRKSHSVNAHALRQLTVSVNHGDERITATTTTTIAAAATAKAQNRLTSINASC